MRVFVYDGDPSPEVVAYAHERDDGSLVFAAGDDAVDLFHCSVVRTASGIGVVHGRGVVAMSLCLHHDDPELADAYYGWTWKHDVPAGIAIDRGAGVLLEDGSITDVVATRPGAHAYTVRHVAGEVICRGYWSRPL